jgi:hypothetical protein
VFAGFMADWQGDYQVGFVILAVLTGFGSIFFLAARKPAFPKRHNAHHSTVDEA